MGGGAENGKRGLILQHFFYGGIMSGKLKVMLVLALMPIVLGARMAGAGELKVGDKMNLSFTSVSGQQVNMQALAGKIVVVDMWATWCGPCMHEAPHMVAINQKYGAKGLQLIGISLDEDKSALLATLPTAGLTWPQYFDGQGWKNKFAVQWGVASIPRTFLVGPDGTILWTGHPSLIDGPIEDAFKDHPPILVDPAIVAAANKSLDEVDKDLVDQKQSAAIKVLAGIAPDATKDEKFAARMDAEKKKLGDAADGMLAEIQPLVDQKQYVEAAARLSNLCIALGSLPQASQARQKLDALMANPDAKAAIDHAKKEATANDALTAAQKLQTDKKDEEAYRSFKNIVKAFKNTSAAPVAAAAVAAYEKDPDFVKKANTDATAGQANAALALANSYRAAGLTDKATNKYQMVIDQYPNTTQAETAAKALKEMADSQ
jgi:thiol-disulfide isomerase/thioredoxin